MIQMIPIVCPRPTCGHAHSTTAEALASKPCCPFCGEPVQAAALDPPTALAA